MRQRKYPPRYPGQMLAKIPCEKRRKEVERSYERISNRQLFYRINMDKSFKHSLERAEEIVATWPAWKQTSLLVTAMATTPHPRDPVSVDAGASAGYGDSRSRHGDTSLPIGWSVSTVGNQLLGNEFCIGGTDTPQTQSKSPTIPMPIKFLEDIADIDMHFVDEDRGSGYYWCPACFQKASVRWDWGTMHGSGLDIKHAQHCPIRIAREILDH